MGNKLSSKRKSAPTSRSTTPAGSLSTGTTTATINSKHRDAYDQNTISSQSSTTRRRMHQVANSSYWFPNDDEEMDRLIGQHFALKAFLNGNIVESCIPHVPTPLSEGAKVLDLGCGGGAWVMDFATEYPSAECIGVDMVDVFPKAIRPTNVNFEVANVLEGLPFPDNSFDFVYVRLLLVGLKSDQWEPMWREVYRILKPGGCAQSVEAGMLVKGNEFVNKAGKAFIDMMYERNQEPFVSQKMDKIMANVNYNVLHYELKDIYLGKQDNLSREFVHDICCIFTGAEPVLSKALNVPTEEWPAFVKKLGIEMQKQPDAMWSYGVCFAQKPIEEASS
ncbi:S-adenosyl-L-methionine-dependent methyltransferase [Phascolomyces articulosus]|uniref:S-adenosyl-L-methionine-dependent methyltransferase n=1 Tax=Phascolomyces articulosus TaxID=60185 RepID=A0AAD5PKD8_9FUNG|nr:S-adenosyl-L-methionine-dependent methyltransferase [Phascolomyces articulosus]